MNYLEQLKKPSTATDKDHYELVLRETLAIAEAARDVHFAGLTADLPLTQPSTSPLSVPKEMEQEMKHNRRVNEFKEKVEELRLERIRCQFEQPSSQWVAERLPALEAQRDKFLDIVSKAKDPADDDFSWAEQMTKKTTAGLELLLDYKATSRYMQLITRLCDEINRPYIPQHTKSVLVQMGDALHQHYMEQVHYQHLLGGWRVTAQAVEAVIEEWKKLLLLQARANAWVFEVENALIGSEMCIAYGDLQWLGMGVRSARKHFVELPDELTVTKAQNMRQVLVAMSDDLDANPKRWPKGAYLIEEKVHSFHWCLQLEEALKKDEHVKEVSAVYEDIALAFGKVTNKRTINGAHLHHESEQIIFEGNLKTIKEIREAEHNVEKEQLERSGRAPNVHLANELGELRKLIVAWYATLYQDKLRRDQTRLVKDEKSLGAGRAHGGVVAAVISARTARRYNI